MKLRASLLIAAIPILVLPTAMATIAATNGTFGTTNRNARYVDGGGWFESTITTDWVEGSWSNGNTTAFPTGMICLFDGAAANGYIYQSLGTVTAGDVAQGTLRITCDFCEKSDDTTVNGTFNVYAGTMASPANGTDIASAAGLTSLFSRTMTPADQGLTAASGNNSCQTAKVVGDIDISGLAPGTQLWIRVCRPSSGSGDFIIDNLAAAVVTSPLKWDINGTTAGAGGTSPSGTWDDVTANWTTATDGVGTTAAWTDGKPALFAAGTDATGSYTVTVSGTRSTNSLTVEEGSVLLSGGQINLVAPATLSAATGSQLRVESIVGGTAGVSTSGAGTTILAGVNNYSGATTLAGTVKLDGGAAVPDSSPVVVASGAVVTLLADETIGDLSGTGSIALGGKTLRVGTATATSSFGGGFTGAGSLIKQGGGTLTLSGGSSVTGTVTVNEGNLSTQVASSGNGTFATASSVTINNGGTLTSGSNGLFGFNNNPVPVTVNAGGTLTVDGGASGGPNIFGTLTLAGGMVAENSSIHPTYGSYNFGGASIIATGATTSTLSARDFQLRNAATTVQVDAGSTLNVTGYFTGLGHATTMAINKTGAGKLILASATASSHGPTNVNNGTLEITGVHGTGNITVASGATLAGTGSISGAVTAAGILAPGTTGTGTLTTGAVTLSGIYQCQLDGANCDKLAAGSLTLTGATLAISTVTTPTAASYVIATYTGTVPAFTTVTGLPAGYAVNTATAGQIKLVGNPSYSAWATGKGLTIANGGMSQDPDGDLQSNLQEYAFGTHPIASDSGPITYAGGMVTGHGQPTTSVTNITNGVDFRAVFGRRKDYVAAGLTYTVQFSADMTNWVDNTVTPEVVASDSEMDAVTVPYPFFVITARGVEKPTFFRVAVSVNP